VLERINGPSAGALAGPRTSMRNHLPCRVARLDSGGARDPMVRVAMVLADGAELASLVTRESAELLGLEPGLAVLALCKATAVRVTAEGASAPPGDQLNGLVGRALRLSRGVQRDEVAVAVAGGLRLVGFAARPNPPARGQPRDGLGGRKRGGDRAGLRVSSQIGLQPLHVGAPAAIFSEVSSVRRLFPQQREQRIVHRRAGGQAFGQAGEGWRRDPGARGVGDVVAQHAHREHPPARVAVHAAGRVQAEHVKGDDVAWRHRPAEDGNCSRAPSMSGRSCRLPSGNHLAWCP
jgi:molybdopterin-binding protein